MLIILMEYLLKIFQTHKMCLEGSIYHGLVHYGLKCTVRASQWPKMGINFRLTRQEVDVHLLWTVKCCCMTEEIRAFGLLV